VPVQRHDVQAHLLLNPVHLLYLEAAVANVAWEPALASLAATVVHLLAMVMASDFLLLSESVREASLEAVTTEVTVRMLATLTSAHFLEGAHDEAQMHAETVVALFEAPAESWDVMPAEVKYALFHALAAMLNSNNKVVYHLGVQSLQLVMGQVTVTQVRVTREDDPLCVALAPAAHQT
jgi:hypothetical protein